MSDKDRIIKEDSIDLSILMSRLWKDKIFIIVISFGIALVGVIYSLMLTNIYMSVSKLGPSESYQSSASGGGLSSSGLGSLAALAGVNLSSSSSSISKVQIAIETAKSKDFYRYHVVKRNLLPALLFIKGFDQQSENVIYDEAYYDPVNNTWPNGMPNINAGYKALHTNFAISQDKRTGVITMTMKSSHPQLSKIMLENLITDLNEYLKSKDSKEAKAALDYLTRQAEQTGSPEMKRGLVNLALQKSSILMVSEISDQYALTYIDSANVPIEKVSPRRSIIVLIFGLVGIFLGSVISILQPKFLSGFNQILTKSN